MITCRYAEANYKASKVLNIYNQEKSKIAISHRERTWHNLDADAINSKLKVCETLQEKKIKSTPRNVIRAARNSVFIEW